jgi:hypothetical protein
VLVPVVCIAVHMVQATADAACSQWGAALWLRLMAMQLWLGGLCAAVPPSFARRAATGTAARPHARCVCAGSGGAERRRLDL